MVHWRTFWCALPLVVAARALEAQQLSLDSLLAQPVQSAAKYTQTMTEAAAAVTIITADDIRRYGYRTLEDILRRVPDLYTSYDRNYTYLGVRGFSRPTDYNDRVLLLVNGHTTNEAVNGSAGLGTEQVLDPDAIERVEVVQGPGSALYGTGAMFASINIVTKDGTALDGVRVAAGGGSLGTVQGAAAAGGVLGRDLNVGLAGQWTYTAGADQFYPEFDSAATNRGVAHHLDWDRYGSAMATLEWRGFTVTGLAATRTKAIPTASFGMQFNDSRARTLDASRFLDVGYAAELTPTVHLQLRGSAQRYSYEGWYPYTSTLTQDASVDDRLGSEAELRWDMGPRNRLLAGLELDRHAQARYHYWSADTTYVDFDAPFNVASAHLQDEYQVTRDLSVVLGARYEAYGRYKPVLAPRGALVYHPFSGSTMKLLYGQAFRAPSVYETNYSDPISGQKRSVDLQAEHITTLEAIWQQRLGGDWFVTASVYRYTVRDLIDTQLDPSDSLLQYRNIARVRATGGSIALNAAFAGGVGAYASVALEDAEDASAEVQLTNSPASIVKAGVALPLTPWASASAEVRHESSRVTVYGTRTDPYLWTGVHLLITPFARSPGLLGRSTLSVGVQNALNAHYALPGGFEHRQAAIEQDGRTVDVGLGAAW